MRLERHTFITLAGDWRRHVLGPAMTAEQDCAIGDWQASGRPFVVASSPPDDPQDCVRLGLSTPTKVRQGFCVARSAISAILPPLRIADVAAACPPTWEHACAMLTRLLAKYDSTARVFGSVAWAFHSRLQFVHSQSDLDLEIRSASSCDLDGMIGALMRLPGPPRLDGELRLPDSRAVPLREFASRPTSLLVKGHGGPALIPYAAVRAMLLGAVS